jgi:hypothetical protein
MKFKVQIEGVEYETQPSGSVKVNYIVKDGNSTYEIALNANGEWICHNYYHGAYPLPISDIGEAIQQHYGT